MSVSTSSGLGRGSSGNDIKAHFPSDNSFYVASLGRTIQSNKSFLFHTEFQIRRIIMFNHTTVIYF